MSLSLEMDGLVHQIQSMGWDEFHTVLEPVSSEEEKHMLLSLVAKVISSRPVAASVVNATLEIAWANINEFLVEEMESNTYLFHFLRRRIDVL